MQRIRTIDNTSRIGGGTYSTSLCNGTTTSSSQSGPRVGTYLQTVDYTVPGFHKLRNKGVISNNPFGQTRWDFSYGGSHVRTIQKNSCSGANSDLKTETHSWFLSAVMAGALSTSSTPSPLLDVGSPLTSTLTAAYAGVKAPDLQGLVSLAEARKTLAMLRRPLSSLRNYINRADRGPGHNHFGDHAKVLPGSWLELRYGWFPFMYDIEGVLKALNRRVQERYTSRSNTTLSTTSSQNFFAANDAAHIVGCKATITEEVKVRSGVLYAHDFDLSDRLGFSLSDIPSSAWELLPYSFVVDWFVNVGDLIAALTPKVGLSHLAAWSGYVRTIDYKREITSFALGPALSGAYTVTSSPVGAYERLIFTQKSREPRGLSNVGVTLTTTLSDTHVKDLLALITQRIF